MLWGLLGSLKEVLGAMREGTKWGRDWERSRKSKGVRNVVGYVVLDAGVLEAAVRRKWIQMYVNMMPRAIGRRQENSRIPILRVWLSKPAVASTGLSGLSSRAYSAQLAQAEEYVSIDTRSTDA